MAISDFFPFTTGAVLTVDQWNELFNAIRDGSFFDSDAPISGTVASLAERVRVLEQEIAVLKDVQAKLSMREQLVASAKQSIFNLGKAPISDSEVVALNGVVLARTGTSADFVGDYSLDGKVITLAQDVYDLVVSGDVLNVSYQYYEE